MIHLLNFWFHITKKPVSLSNFSSQLKFLDFLFHSLYYSANYHWKHTFWHALIYIFIGLRISNYNPTFSLMSLDIFLFLFLFLITYFLLVFLFKPLKFYMLMFHYVNWIPKIFKGDWGPAVVAVFISFILQC